MTFSCSACYNCGDGCERDLNQVKETRLLTVNTPMMFFAMNDYGFLLGKSDQCAAISNP